MSGLDLEAILSALADQIRAYIDDDWNVYAYEGEAPSAGSFLAIALDGVMPWGSFTASGYAEITGRITLNIDAANAQTAFKRVCRALSVGATHGSSVVDAVMSDRTLGGLVADTIAAPPDTPIRRNSPVQAEIPFRILVHKQGAQV